MKCCTNTRISLLSNVILQIIGSDLQCPMCSEKVTAAEIILVEDPIVNGES